MKAILLASALGLVPPTITPITPITAPPVGHAVEWFALEPGQGAVCDNPAGCLIFTAETFERMVQSERARSCRKEKPHV